MPINFVLTKLAEDNFATDSNESPLPNPPWQLNGGFNLKVSSGLASAILSSGMQNYSAQTPNDDQYASATVADVSGWGTFGLSNLRLVVRAAGSNESGFLSYANGYMLAVFGQSSGNSTLIQVFSTVNGSNTLITTSHVGTALADDDVWVLAAIGTTLYVLQNGTVVWSGTDSTFSSGFTAFGSQNDSDTAAPAFASLFAMGNAAIGPDPVFNPLTNPFLVNAVMSASYKTLLAAAGDGTFQTCRISKVQFVGAVQGDNFIITDPIDGHVIVPGQSDGNDLTISFVAKPLLVRDFIVSTFVSASGTLVIYLA